MNLHCNPNHTPTNTGIKNLVLICCHSLQLVVCSAFWHNPQCVEYKETYNWFSKVLQWSLLITKVCATCPLFILCLGIAFLPHQRCDSCSNAVVEVGFRRPVVSLGKLLNPKNYFRWLCRKCVCMREWESLWAIWIGSAALLLMNSWHLPRPAVYECECVRECGWITQGKWALLQLLYLTF